MTTTIFVIGIYHGSKYAKSLGFEGEIAWPADKIGEIKKKKNKKKKVSVCVS